MALHETAARWGATSAGILAIAALGAAVGRHLFAWVIAPWWGRTFSQRMDDMRRQTNTRLDRLEAKIDALAECVQTADGIPLRSAHAEERAAAEQLVRAVEATNQRIDGCIAYHGRAHFELSRMITEGNAKHA